MCRLRGRRRIRSFRSSPSRMATQAPQVPRKLLDPFGQERNLHLWGACVAILDGVLRNHLILRLPRKRHTILRIAHCSWGFSTLSKCLADASRIGSLGQIVAGCRCRPERRHRLEPANAAPTRAPIAAPRAKASRRGSWSREGPPRDRARRKSHSITVGPRQLRRGRGWIARARRRCRPRPRPRQQ